MNFILSEAKNTGDLGLAYDPSQSLVQQLPAGCTPCRKVKHAANPHHLAVIDCAAVQKALTFVWMNRSPRLGSLFSSESRAAWRVILGLTAVYVIIQITTLSRVYALNYLDNLNSPSSEIWRDRVLALLVGLSFIIGIVYLTRNMLRQGWPSFRVLVLNLLLMVPVTMLWYYLFSRTALWLCGVFQDCQQSEEDFLYGYLYNLNSLSLVYLLAVAVSYTYYYVRRADEHRLRESQLETKVLQARMKMLRSQLHPHFLFNTLNSINSLMDIDVPKAQAMIVDLAELLRKVLAWKDTQKVSLHDEIELLRHYVDIEKMRFSEDLNVEWSIATDTRQLPVPGLLLQPLVENAIHHGFSGDHMRINISIEAERQNGHLHLRVRDDGGGFPESEQDDIFEQGTGLQNTLERLRTLYGEDFAFKVYNTHPGVTSEVTIPINKES